MLKARAFGPLTPVHDPAALTVAGPRDAAGSQSQISRGRDLRIIPESRQSTSSHSCADVDVVIVGSGPAGSAYARMIGDRAPNAMVMLVEAGPAITTPPAQHSSTIADCMALDHAIAMSQGPFCGNDGSSQTSTPEQELSADRGAGLFLLSDGNAETQDFPAASASSNVGGMGSHWFSCCPQPGSSEVIGCRLPRMRGSRPMASPRPIVRLRKHGALERGHRPFAWEQSSRQAPVATPFNLSFGPPRAANALVNGFPCSHPLGAILSLQGRINSLFRRVGNCFGK